MSVLKVTNLSKTFSSGWWPLSMSHSYNAVNSISFELNKGEILGFLGPNGAGKTTTIQMLLGTLTPSSGSIIYFDKDFSEHRIEALKKIGFASGYDKLPVRLSVFENLDIVGRMYRISEPVRSQRIENLLQFFGMEKFRDRITGTLSAGQMTRVLLAKAFLGDPEIVLLDEPTASLDPDVAQEVRNFILQQSKERNVSVLITSHNMDEVTQLCDRVLVLKSGTLIANDTPEVLAQSIAKVHLHLVMPHDLERAVTYLQEIQVAYSRQNNTLTIEIDEHAIAELLVTFAQRNIFYSHIAIDKPTLEDYFLSIAK